MREVGRRKVERRDRQREAWRRDRGGGLSRQGRERAEGGTRMWEGKTKVGRVWGNDEGMRMEEAERIRMKRRGDEGRCREQRTHGDERGVEREGERERKEGRYRGEWG